MHSHLKKGEIIHFHAVNGWDEDDLFHEYAEPSIAFPHDTELGMRGA